MSSKSLLLESQTTVLFESVLSEIPFWDPAVLFEFGFKWTQGRLEYLCEWLTAFLLAFSEPFTVQILLFRGVKRRSVWYAYEVCTQPRIYMFRKCTCMTEGMSLFVSITRKVKGEMTIRSGTYLPWAPLQKSPSFQRVLSPAWAIKVKLNCSSAAEISLNQHSTGVRSCLLPDFVDAEKFVWAKKAAVELEMRKDPQSH